MRDERNLARTADLLCAKALHDARTRLHPLLQSADVNRLERRTDFLQAFKSALEERVARQLAAWLPGVQAVFKFEDIYSNDTAWDGNIHLLVEVPRLSERVRDLAKKLDTYLLEHLQQWGWSRFDDQHSMLDVQQVTVDELRHGISYGAMFLAVYNVPVKVWPKKQA